MVGVCDEISEIGKMELVVMGSLHISYLLSSPLVFLPKLGFTGRYEDALGKKFF